MFPTSRVRLAAAALLSIASLAGGGAAALLGLCGPFTDVTDPAFCASVLEIYTLGITTGTTATTYSPNDPVTRLQMAAFLSREADRLLRRGSPRATLKQFSTPQGAQNLSVTSVGLTPQLVASDGADVWVANFDSATVTRVRGSDGRVLGNWTGATFAAGVVAAAGDIFVTGAVTPGRLYAIDPSAPAGSVTTVASSLGSSPAGIAFDGLRIWTADHNGSVSIVTPGPTLPWATTTRTGFSEPIGALYDGANVWVTDFVAGSLLKLDGSGAIMQTVPVGGGPVYPVFDGTNIWVPNSGSGSISVVRASTGAVLATLTGIGLVDPTAAAFDGQRILVTNFAGDNVTLWKAADSTPLGSVSTGSGSRPGGVCSDGINFWITLVNFNQLARF
jgi:hypothetical protein